MFRHILYGSLALLATACQAPHRGGGKYQPEGIWDEGRIIAVENKTHQMVTRVIVLDAYPNRKVEYAVVRRQDTYLQPGATVPIFLPGIKLCVFRLRFEYEDGSYGEVEPRDICQNGTTILLKESHRKKEVIQRDPDSLASDRGY